MFGSWGFFLIIILVIFIIFDEVVKSSVVYLFLFLIFKFDEEESLIKFLMKEMWFVKMVMWSGVFFEMVIFMVIVEGFVLNMDLVVC